MGRSICSKDGAFFVWSTEISAPITPGLSEDAFRAYYQAEYGKRGSEGLEQRMLRARERGTELQFTNLKTLVQYNHLGPQYSSLSLEEIMVYIHTMPVFLT